MKCALKGIVAAIVLVLSFTASAMNSPIAAGSLLYTCDFPRWSDEKGNHVSREQFAMKFAYDDITREAVMIGNNGVAKVTPVVGSQGVSFVEFLATGTIQSTTVTKSGKAVHSRHSIIVDEITPSQYYGTCTTSKG